MLDFLSLDPKFSKEECPKGGRAEGYLLIKLVKTNLNLNKDWANWARLHPTTGFDNKYVC